MSTVTLIRGDARRLPLADKSVQCVVTSPPYLGLRDYGTARWDGGDGACEHLRDSFAPQEHVGSDGKMGRNNTNWDHRNEPHYRDTCGKCGARRVDAQIGLEPSVEAYVASIVRVFREVKRILRDDGTAWVNMGDSYGQQQGAGFNTHACTNGKNRVQEMQRESGDIKVKTGLAPKNLLGIPWRIAFALQADGWILRDAIIWAKGEVNDYDELEGSPMPGSQRDRCTSAYEFVFQFSKKPRYYSDFEAIKTTSGAIPRNVWRINPTPFPGAHFATFPSELVRRCVAAGTSERGQCPTCGTAWRRVVERGESDWASRVEAGASVEGGGSHAALTIGHNKTHGNGTNHTLGLRASSTLGWRPGCTCPAHEPVPQVVLDVFGGAGTVPMVASNMGRRGVMVELSAKYVAMARRRITRPHARPERVERQEHHPLFAGLDE